MFTVDILTDHVFSFLSLKEHVRFSETCRTVNAASKSKIAWNNKSIIVKNVTDLVHFRAFPLQQLTLGCYDITNDGLSYLKNMPLTNLGLCGCDRITDEGLVHLKNMPLQTLVFSWCDLITDVGLSHLKKMPLIYLK